MQIIVCHENADFDAVAALLGAHKLEPDAIPVLPEQQNRNVAAFLALYRSGLPFVPRSDVNLGQVDSITLVDTQKLPPMKGLRRKAQVKVIDHHPVKDDVDPAYTLTGEVIGSTTTLLVEHIQRENIALVPLEATLLALGVYEDTGSLTYGSTTPRDVRAAAWLLEQGAALDTVRRFLEPPLNERQQALFELLLTQAETRVIEGYTVIVCAAKVDHYVTEIAGVAHRLRETLDPSALFILVQMPSALHLVARATDDAIDVGEVARHFGGGGHERAAAASLHDTGYDEALAALWEQVRRVVRPAVRVADLMSHGVQTVDAGKDLKALVRTLRRIGHEGYPVVENGRVVGLLTRRDADRAMEHDLGGIAVREIMSSGNVTLRPSDSVATLERKMVESGWGQIPVVDDDGTPIGIVTRTDLIKHWAQAHPAEPPGETVSLAHIRDVLGIPAAALVNVITRHAQDADCTLYMVGGVVRDLLLKRRNLDVDFVVEGDAITLAQSMRDAFGGSVTSFKPFGTAKWKLDNTVADKLGVEFAALPDHIDFATARNEFYEHPTALPTVYSGSIKLDLARRDFTINTLAVQFSPNESVGHVIDYYGGLNDLRAGLIRVLHNLSFVDDPTRILRAARFEHRLAFAIESRTAELIQTALPMLRRITGERVRNELTLLMRESEPERAFQLLQSRGWLDAIHPALRVDETTAALFGKARETTPPWDIDLPERDVLYWHILAATTPYDQLPALLERLLMPHTQAESMLAAATLLHNAGALTNPDARASEIDAALRGAPDVALYVAWLASDNPLVCKRIVRYVLEWRRVRATTDGNALKAMGLQPGPCFGVILGRLRSARLDGEITSDEAERELLRTLLDEGVCA